MPQESKPFPLGTLAPDFALRDVTTGRTVTRDDARGPRGLLVLFLCNHCPYVVHVQDELARIGRDYSDSGIGIVAIGSNDPATYPEDAPERLAEQAQRVGFAFPYLFDETQGVARAYDAACTPDIYLFDGALRLAYHGRLDDSRPTNDRPVTGADLRAALDAVAAGRAVEGPQWPSVGCGIKWRR